MATTDRVVIVIIKIQVVKHASALAHAFDDFLVGFGHSAIIVPSGGSGSVGVDDRISTAIAAQTAVDPGGPEMNESSRQLFSRLMELVAVA